MSSTITRVPVETTFGKVDFRYNICTPSDVSANCVDSTIPTILFLHGEYSAVEAWQNQFHSSLRRFNLVTFDLRSHGETISLVPTGYSRVEAAAETVLVMDALNLPPCHIVGTSLGADIGLQMAIDFPDRVLSLTLISPLPDHQEEHVATARQEIFDTWAPGDKESALSAVTGGLQLVNCVDSPLVRSFVALNFPRSRRNWCTDKLDTFENIGVKYYHLNRSREPGTYEKIQCPMLLINCMDDVTPTYAPTMYHELLQAGVAAQMIELEGAPHFACMTHGNQVNDGIEKFLTSLCPGDVAPPVPELITTPWESVLRSLGWKGDTDPDSSDEDVT